MSVMTLPGGATLYYEVHGKGDPVLLCTGLGGLASFWKDYIADLATTRQVIVYDHVGTGQSDMLDPPYLVDEMAEDVVGLLDHLEIETVDFVGHSTGGAIGQLLGARHPRRVRSLLLAATWGRRDPYFKRCFDCRLPLLDQVGKLAYFEATSLLIYPPDWISRNYQMVTELERANAQALLRPDILKARIAAICDFDASAEVHSIVASTLVVGARDDMTTAPFFSRELAEAIKGSQLIMLDWGAHMFPLTAKADFWPVMRDWLAGQREPKSIAS
jgi:aminoacrylate hydrolase